MLPVTTFLMCADSVAISVRNKEFSWHVNNVKEHIEKKKGQQRHHRRVQIHGCGGETLRNQRRHRHPEMGGR